MRKETILKFYLKFRIYIFPIVVVLSSLILITLVIYPQIVKLINNQKVQTDLSAKSKFLEAKASTLENLDQEDLLKKVGYALNAYPPEPDFINALGILQQVASQNGFSITTLSVNSGSSTSGIQKYRIKLDAIGPNSLLSNFITSIESSKRIMKLGSIEISAGKDSNSVNIGLDIEVLYAQEPSSFGGVDSPLPQLSKRDEELISTLAAFNPTSSSQPTPTQVTPSSSRGKANPFE